MTNSILVTGASTGFGPEIALYLAERGFTVYAGIRHLAGEAHLEAAAARRGVRLRTLPLDVTDDHSIAAAVQTMLAAAGGIYGIVCNDLEVLRGYFEDLAEDEIRRVFEVNLFGAMAVTRAVLPHMRVARRGRLVFISSVAGKIGAPSGSAYVATRFAQEGFGEALYQEVAPFGVFVSLIEPGITHSSSWTIDLWLAARAKDPNSPYYAWFNRAEAIFDQALQSSPIITADVARAVYAALTAARPRLRYPVGRRARAVMAARRYLPGELFNRLYFGTVMRRITSE